MIAKAGSPSLHDPSYKFKWDMMKWLSVTHLTEACYCHLISASYTQLIPNKQLIPFKSPEYWALKLWLKLERLIITIGKMF